jgi:hypothetical protein
MNILPIRQYISPICGGDLMIIINTLADIYHWKSRGAISSPLAIHLEKKLRNLNSALAPDISEQDFSLDASGNVCILEIKDRDLSKIGLPELLQIMPEWISRLDLAGEIYYILYIMVDNDCVVQVYLPDLILKDKIRLWLQAQPVEEELDGGGEDVESSEPF